MVSKFNTRVMITLSNQVLSYLDEIAANLGCNRSELITKMIIEEKLERTKGR